MLNDLNTRDLGYTRYRDSKIYMAERLTKKRKELFKSCQKKKRDIYGISISLDSKWSNLFTKGQ